MTTRTITAECDSCESSFEVFYMEELTSEDLPEFCPFCGEHIEKITEETTDDAEYDDEDDKWQ
jgi:hypothetical protein